jgi:DNA-binding CsgD family transcriptional regulator
MTQPNSLQTLTAPVSELQRNEGHDHHNPKVLTNREQEILSWIAQGKSDASIGQILNISSKTVNYHVENAKRKFAVATRIQAVIAAMGQNMLKR